jgi:hypothetical protein
MIVPRLVEGRLRDLLGRFPVVALERYRIDSATEVMPLGALIKGFEE